MRREEDQQQRDARPIAATRGGSDGTQAKRLVQAAEAVSSEIDGHVLVAERAQLSIDRVGDRRFERAGNLVASELEPRDRVVMAHPEHPEAEIVQHALGALDLPQLFVGDFR